LTDALRGFFLARTQHLDAWHTTARAGLAAATQAGDDRTRAAMLITLGTVHWGLCDLGAYLDHTLAAADLAEQAGWTYGHAVALGNGGHACLGMGRLTQGVELMEQALEMRREQGDAPARLAAALRTTGQIHAHLGNLPTALEHFSEALALARELGAVLNELDALGGLSWVHWQLGNTREAEALITETLALAREHDAQYRESVCLRRLAEVSLSLGRRTEAGSLARQAVELARTSGRRYTEVDVLNTAGRVTLNLGNPDQARQHHEDAHDLAGGDAPYAWGIVDAQVGLAAAHQALGHLDKATEVATEAVRRAAEPGYRVLHGQALGVLAETELARGNRDQARTYAREALELHRATGHRPGEEKIQALLTKL
jgi:tetratricopeptide (TPR) repeat protein